MTDKVVPTHIALPLEAYQKIGVALQEIPFKFSAGLIQHIQSNAQEFVADPKSKKLVLHVVEDKPNSGGA